MNEQNVPDAHARPTHVLVECPELIASVRVGVLDPLEPLVRQGLCQVLFRETKNMAKADLAWCDILICVRGCETLTEHIVREAKRLGRKVFYFLDDDLLHLPEESQSREYFDYGGHQQALRDILAMSDGLWGCNSLIRDDYLPLCGTRRWICTRVPAHVPALPPARDPGPVRVLYAGSTDHEKIVREVLAPAVRLAAQRCGGGVEFTFVGPDPRLNDVPQARYHRFFDDYGQYREFVAGGGYQIGLAPTRTGDFFQHKYYNKFVEYSSIGAAGIYTDCPLYRQVVRDGENGLLCANTPEAWAEAIVRLVTDEALRRSCRENAAELLRAEFTPEQVAEKLLEQTPELRDFRGPEVDASRVRLYSCRVYFYVDRAKYLFHQYRALAVPLILWKAVKKLYKSVFGRRSC